MMKLMRFKWKYLLASLLLANIIACSNDDLAQMSNRLEQDSGARTAELFTQTIILETAGTLEAKLTEAMGETDVTTLEKLVVSGPFTAADMQYVRDSLTGLVAIDMKDAVIKASDEAYHYTYDTYFMDNQLAAGMFYNMDNLKEVVLPSTITSIGREAFRLCDNLVTVIIPDAVTKIEYEAFGSCNVLTSVILPNNLETIEGWAFYDCDSLKTIVIPDKVEEIANYTFYKCDSLSSVTLPSGLKSIEDWAFYDCYSLQSMVLPENLESLGQGAFAGCLQMSSINIPEGIKEISNSCFFGCRSMMEFILPEGLEIIGNSSFHGCDKVKTFELPITLNRIGEWAFESCDMLEELVVPANVTSVGSYFVTNCYNLRAVIWNPTIDVPYNYGVHNTFLYVNTDQIAVENIDDWKAVVIDGVAESTVDLSVSRDDDYVNLKEFKAKKQIYTRHFGDETVPGASSGWQTIVLPFTPDSIYHESKGQIAPFNSNIEGAKPFWLRELTPEGFKDVTRIEANKAYIIAMPNHNDYLEEYRLNGTITFVARDSVLRVTPDALDASIGPDYELHPTYQYIEQSEDIYTLGSIWNYYEEENMYYGKSFFRKNYNSVSAFNAYVTALGGGRSSRSVFDLDTRSKETRAAWQPNTTGIPQIGDM